MKFRSVIVFAIPIKIKSDSPSDDEVMRSLNRIICTAAFLVVIMALTLLLNAGRSEAAPVLFQFTGLVGDMPNSQYGFNAELVPGVGYAVVSSTTESHANAEMTANIVQDNGSIQDLAVNVGAYMARLGERPSIFTFKNIHLYNVDRHRLGINWPFVNTFNEKEHNATRFYSQAGELTENIFSGFAMPTSPSVSSFAQMQLRLVLEADGMVVNRVFNSLSLVPLPAALWLFTAGLIALVALGTRGWMPRKETQAY